VPGIVQRNVRSCVRHDAADATTLSLPLGAAQAVITRLDVAEPSSCVATPTPVAVASIVAATTPDRIKLGCMHLEYR
jgi:hypothetical protein